MSSPTGRTPPNVLFIIADDHRHDALGVSGHPAVRTPHLDALAARGTRFTHAYQMGGLVAAVCSPARASLLTGRNVVAADDAQVASSSPGCKVALPSDCPTLPQIFRAAGYETFITGKWHNDVPALQRSFSGGSRIFIGGMSDHRHVPLHEYSKSGDYSSPPHFEHGFSTELFCDAAVDFLARPRGPFFLYLALTSPHDPRTPPSEFARQYVPPQMPLPANFEPEHPFDNGELAIRDETLAAKPLSGAALQTHLADYYGMIAHQDAQLGRVFDALRTAGLESSTIVVYVSDHGLALGSHGLLGKQNLYEHSLRVPLIMAGPGVEAGAINHSLVYSMDLYASLAGLAGLAPTGPVDSRPLVSLNGSTPAQPRENIFAMYKDCQRMVRDGRWKLIRYHVKGRDRLQLFDLENDPDELTDLSSAPRHAKTIRRLLGLLVDWQDRVGDRWMPRLDSGPYSDVT
jgi:arylsulfatase A-like enzyme